MKGIEMRSSRYQQNIQCGNYYSGCSKDMVFEFFRHRSFLISNGFVAHLLMSKILLPKGLIQIQLFRNSIFNSKNIRWIVIGHLPPVITFVYGNSWLAVIMLIVMAVLGSQIKAIGCTHNCNFSGCFAKRALDFWCAKKYQWCCKFRAFDNRFLLFLATISTCELRWSKFIP